MPKKNTETEEVSKTETKKSVTKKASTSSKSKATAAKAKKAPAKVATSKKKEVAAKVETETKEVVKEAKDETKKTVKAKADSVKKEAKKEPVATKKVEEKKPVKKASTKKQATKKTTVKKEDKTKEVVEDTKETVEETKVEISEPEVVQETISVEPIKESNNEGFNNSVKTESITTEELNAMPDPKTKKKGVNKILVAVLVVLALVIALGITGICLLNNTNDLKEHFDDVEAYKAELVASETTNSSSDEEDSTSEDSLTSSELISTNESEEAILAGRLLNCITINEETGDATLAIGKPLVYTYADLDFINSLEQIKNNNLVIDQIGYDFDTDNSLMNVYAAFTYKGFLKGGAVAQLKYTFTDTDLVITFDNAKIGNLPEFLYKDKLPASGTELYRLNISEINVVNDIKIRLLDPTLIKDISYEDNKLLISLNLEEVFNSIIDDLFNIDDETGSSKFIDIITYYANEFFKTDENGNSTFNSLISEGFSLVQDAIGDIDISKLLG